LLASDPTFDGRFFTGVLTTGIYCLPSCRARKPKAENVRFFGDVGAARAAGLRACKKCHPDDYVRGVDVVLAMLEQVVAEVRAAPEKFADAAAVVRRIGFGTTRATELVRFHYHVTPAELLARARLAAWQRAVHAGVSVTEAGYAAGYGSLSVVHEHCRARLGLSPGGWQELGRPEAREFTLELPEGFSWPLLRGQLGRDPGSLSERVTEGGFALAGWLGGVAARVEAEYFDGKLVVKIYAAEDAGRRLALAPWAHTMMAGVVGLGADTAGLVKRARKLGLERLVTGRSGWGGSRTPSMWDALVWAIIGQQINLAFAFKLRRAVTELAGEPVGDGLVALPMPERVAALDVPVLRARQFSANKAATLIEVARRVAAGEIDLTALAAGAATRAERVLLAVPGLGPWTVNYVLMRGAGLADCVPYGDTGVTSGLQRLLGLETRPDVDATRRLLLPWSPYRSLAVYQLWQYNGAATARPMVESGENDL
jgi:AraC family transcriptional regulator of adaptative response / DNA-3-methyladenine glycosylase II